MYVLIKKIANFREMTSNTDTIKCRKTLSDVGRQLCNGM